MLLGMEVKRGCQRVYGQGTLLMVDDQRVRLGKMKQERNLDVVYSYIRNCWHR